MGYNQQQFAEALKRKPGVVSAWEKGKSLPDLASLLGVCETLNTTPDDLLAAAGVIDASSNTAAQSVHPLSWKSSAIAPERAMKDATFRKAWIIVGKCWLDAKAAKFKADHPATKEWDALFTLLKKFEGVGETPETAREETWPETGNPLLG